MENRKIKIAILGGGISGLSIAYQLKQNDNYDVTVYERKSEPGGSMITEQLNSYLADLGPNSGLETTPLISKIVQKVGLANDMIYANEEANKRYILKNDSLHALPTSPIKLMKSSLFSLKGKLRLFGEPFIRAKKDDTSESIYDFVVRRLGVEFADYAIDPFVSGVFAGDPHQLCVKSAFPKVKDLELKYGGLIKGMILGAKERKKRKEVSKNYAKMFTFIDGMQSFPKAIANYLGDTVKLSSKIRAVELSRHGYRIHGIGPDNSFVGDEYDIVIPTVPAYIAARLLFPVDRSVSETLLKVYYPLVRVLFVVYKKEQIGQPLDGFGFLNPGKENKNFLGAIWSSTIFPNRAPEDYAAFTLFIGGAKAPEETQYTDLEIQKLALAEFKDIMKIKGPFVFIKEKKWKRAIPQYNLNHRSLESNYESFEEKHKGILLAGNYRGGISVGDCIKNSLTIAERVDTLVKNNHVPQKHKIESKRLNTVEEKIKWVNFPPEDYED